jgi:hypothetical protein
MEIQNNLPQPNRFSNLRSVSAPRANRHTEFVLVVGLCLITAIGYVAYSTISARTPVQSTIVPSPVQLAVPANNKSAITAQTQPLPIAPPVATLASIATPRKAAPTVVPATAVPVDLSTLSDATPITDLRTLDKQPFALVRASGPRDGVRIDALTFDLSTGLPNSRRATPLHCERMYYAGGRIACARLENDSSRWHINLTIYSQDFKEEFKTEVPGATISRVRVSADGRFGAMTNFVVGHSYNDAFGFSTATHIIDLNNQELMESLETWPLLHNGERVFAIDLNLWGVTFMPGDSDHFFATARYNRKNYLVEGRISTKQMTVIYDNVECPSISPDGTRIAFKQAVPGFGWVPAIVDLKTMQQTTLDEASSLDDQIEWLDASQIIYELRAGAEGELRVRDARANTPSKRWLGNASSPAVTRP